METKREQTEQELMDWTRETLGETLEEALETLYSKDMSKMDEKQKANWYALAYLFTKSQLHILLARKEPI